MFCPLKYFNVCSLLISSHKPKVFLLEKVAFMAVNSLISSIDHIFYNETKSGFRVLSMSPLELSNCCEDKKVLVK